jgi:hypothetical protein
MIQVIGEAMGELRAQIELRELRVDVCDTKSRYAELRISFSELCEQLSAGHGTAIDLPPLPLGSSRAN